MTFFKCSLKTKWSDFVAGVIFGPLFSNNNCDVDNMYDDKLMIFGDKIFICKIDDGSA